MQSNAIKCNTLLQLELPVGIVQLIKNTNIDQVMRNKNWSLKPQKICPWMIDT